MSHYFLCRALFELNDPDRRAEYRDDPAAFVDSREGLDSDERAELRSVDLAALQRRRVPIYLLRTLALVHHIGFEEVGAATSDAPAGGAGEEMS